MGEEMDLLKGTLDVLVLEALATEPRHGYDVARWIRETTDDVLQVEDGALYAALHRLEKRGRLESEWGLSENNRRARFYRITTKGRAELERRRTAWNRYAEAVFKVLRGPARADG